jgi:hypothetical protein
MKHLIKQILKEETDKLEQDNPIVQAMISIIPNEYEGLFYVPYDNEQYYDYHIKFHVTKISLWDAKEEREKFNSNAILEGTIYVKIDRLLVGIGQYDEWERMYEKDDLSETAWDDFIDYVSDTISKWFPNYDVDVDITF